MAAGPIRGAVGDEAERLPLEPDPDSNHDKDDQEAFPEGFNARDTETVPIVIIVAALGGLIVLFRERAAVA